MNRKLRGIRIVKRRDDQKVSLKLMLVNEQRYVVSYRVSVLGFFYRHRKFEFEDMQDAEYFYDRALLKLFPFRVKNSRL